MILVDTNVWIAHFRASNPLLVKLLEDGKVVLHPYVQIEIALGSIANRIELIGALAQMPTLAVAEPHELSTFIENKKLYSQGIGLVDCHLLLSAVLDANCKIWTTDKRLHAMATAIGVHFDHPDVTVQ